MGNFMWPQWIYTVLQNKIIISTQTCLVAACHGLHFAALHTLLPWGLKHRTIIAHACAVFACFIAALVAYLKYDQSCIPGQVSWFQSPEYSEHD